MIKYSWSVNSLHFVQSCFYFEEHLGGGAEDTPPPFSSLVLDERVGDVDAVSEYMHVINRFVPKTYWHTAVRILLLLSLHRRIIW